MQPINLTDAEKFSAGERVREALGDVQLRLARLRSHRGQRRGEEFQAHAANARKEIQFLSASVEALFLDINCGNSKLVAKTFNLHSGPYYYKTSSRPRREEEYYYTGGSSLDKPRSVRASKYQISKVPGP